MLHSKGCFCLERVVHPSLYRLVWLMSSRGVTSRVIIIPLKGSQFYPPEEGDPIGPVEGGFSLPKGIGTITLKVSSVWYTPEAVFAFRGKSAHPSTGLYG